MRAIESRIERLEKQVHYTSHIDLSKLSDEELENFEQILIKSGVTETTDGDISKLSDGELEFLIGIEPKIFGGVSNE